MHGNFARTALFLEGLLYFLSQWRQSSKAQHEFIKVYIPPVEYSSLICVYINVIIIFFPHSRCSPQPKTSFFLLLHYNVMLLGWSVEWSMKINSFIKSFVNSFFYYYSLFAITYVHFYNIYNVLTLFFLWYFFFVVVVVVVVVWGGWW